MECTGYKLGLNMEPSSRYRSRDLRSGLGSCDEMGFRFSDEESGTVNIAKLR